MTLSPVVHSRKATGGKDNWRTPQGLFDTLDAEFNFEVDAAADETNHLCDYWYGPGDGLREDALALPNWGPRKDLDDEGATRGFEPIRTFLNPPYSRNADFVRKARAEADAGNALVVLLLPARTDVQWFHDLCWDRWLHQPRPRTEVRFIKGRLKFDDGDTGAPFPSMVVVFHPSVAFTYED